MATNAAIIAAATHYAFMKTGETEGVMLLGPLGGIALWDDGTVEMGASYEAPYTLHIEEAVREAWAYCAE